MRQSIAGLHFLEKPESSSHFARLNFTGMSLTNMQLNAEFMDGLNPEGEGPHRRKQKEFAVQPLM